MKRSDYDHLQLHPSVRLAIDAYLELFDRDAPLNVRRQLEQWSYFLLEEFRRFHPYALYLVRHWFPGMAEAEDEELSRLVFELSDARLVIAREHGFSNWEVLSELEEPELDPIFEQAVDYITTGNTQALREWLVRYPQLVKERSRWGHRCTLLHYVAANGVETRRQIAPPNGPEIAKLLLSAGAEVDAVAMTYGGGETQTPICLLVSSEHPYVEGTTRDLVKAFVDAGTKLDGRLGEYAPLVNAIASHQTEAVDALIAHGATVNNLVFAAASGSLERVESELGRDAEDELVSDYVVGFFPELRQDCDRLLRIRAAMEVARRHQRTDIVDFLDRFAAELTEILDAFDERHAQGTPISIVDAIPPQFVGGIRRYLMFQMVSIEQDYQWASRRSSENGSSGGIVTPLRQGPHLIEYYLEQYPELGGAESVPANVVVEEFRIRTELEAEPADQEYQDRFPHLREVIPGLFDEVRREVAVAASQLELAIYHEGNQVFEMRLRGPLELGRQMEGEPEPYATSELQNIERLVIANKDERLISRTQLRITPLSDGRILVANCSKKNVVKSRHGTWPLPPGDEREYHVPAAFTIGAKSIEVTLNQ